MVRVASYNLYLGADLSVVFGVGSPEDLERRAAAVHAQVLATDFPGRAAAVAAILVRERVDVVGLQEVAQWTRVVEGVGGGTQREVWLDFLEELLAALRRRGEEYAVQVRTPSFHGGSRTPDGERLAVVGHNVVLVRRSSPVRVTATCDGAFRRTWDIPTGMPGVVLNVARSWSWVDAEVHGHAFRFVNTHTEAWDPAVRDAQRDELLDELGRAGRPVVLVGDLNATPERVGLPRTYVDAWQVAGDGGPGFTCGQAADLTNSPSALDKRIDYVFVRGARVETCRVVGGRTTDRTPAGLWPSDHAGVVADVTFGA